MQSQSYSIFHHGHGKQNNHILLIFLALQPCILTVVCMFLVDTHSMDCLDTNQIHLTRFDHIIQRPIIGLIEENLNQRIRITMSSTRQVHSQFQATPPIINLRNAASMALYLFVRNKKLLMDRLSKVSLILSSKQKTYSTVWLPHGLKLSMWRLDIVKLEF